MTELDRAFERRRQIQAKDEDFKRLAVCFFEIALLSDSLDSETFYLIPFPIPPRIIDVQDEFAIDEAVGADGGLHVEENGVVKRRIRLEGDFAFRPRPANPWASIYGGPKPAEQTFNPRFATATDLNLSLSGYRHFQYMQDSLRTYGDLKKDPETAERVELRFHNQRDRQHWRVHLVSFEERQDERTRISSPGYVIDMLVSGPAEVTRLRTVQDAGFLEQIKNAVQTIKRGVAIIQSAVQKVVGYIEDVRRVVGGITGIVDSAIAIADDALEIVSVLGNTVDDVANLDDRVKARGRALAEKAQTTATRLYSALENLIGADVPAQVSGDLDTMADGLAHIVMHRAAFDPTTGSVSIDSLVSDIDASLADDLASADAESSFDDVLNAGSGARAGDGLLSGAERLGLSSRGYKSAREYAVEQGDTLETIAAKTIGDASAWRDIALLNQLEPPYVSAAGVPGTVGVGSRILVPSTRQPTALQATHGVVGVRSGASPEERLLGVDMALVPCSGEPECYDWVVDTARGSTDAVKAVGISNLSQALRTRVELEQGGLPGYPSVGRVRDIRSGRPELDREMKRLRISQAVLADPRITAVESLSFPEDGDSPDISRVEIVATIRDLDQSQAFEVRGA